LRFRTIDLLNIYVGLEQIGQCFGGKEVRFDNILKKFAKITILILKFSNQLVINLLIICTSLDKLYEVREANLMTIKSTDKQ